MERELSPKMAQRMNLLQAMDNYVRYNIEDEEIICDLWFATGLPDGWDEEDLYSIAEDNEQWLLAIKTFHRCCSLDEV